MKVLTLQIRSYGEKPSLHMGHWLLVTSIPMCSDAVFAEVVSTWCTDWISEHIQTDGAQKLIFRLQIAGSSHIYKLRTKVKVL